MILVTGGTGFIGSYLLLDLIKSGEKVRALKRKNSSTSNVFQIFSYYSTKPHELFSKIEWVEGDILDIESLSEAMKGITDVYHCAGSVSFSPSDKEKMMEININGTENIVTASLENNVRKLCYVSSTSALETKIISNYSISKRKAEQKISAGIAKGLNAIIVNPSIVLGAGNWDNNNTNIFVAVWKGFRFYSKGEGSFVDVRDVSSAMIKLMKSDITNERFIITSENYSYKMIIDKIAENFKVKKPFIYISPLLSKVVWQVETIQNILFDKEPILSEEMLKLANNKTNHSNLKIKNSIDINFISIEKSIKHICKIFIKNKIKDYETTNRVSIIGRSSKRFSSYWSN